jgi:hypothetical protein
MKMSTALIRIERRIEPVEISSSHEVPPYKSGICFGCVVTSTGEF